MEEFARCGLDEIDYVLCLNSTEKPIQNMVGTIMPQGKICSIVSIEYNPPINMTAFLSKSIAFVLELMFTRPMFQTANIQAQHNLLEEAARLLDEGVLRSTVTEQGGELTAENLRKAHAKLETGAMIGKLVLGAIGNG